jgi:outer membrane protein OmpA-like peptidoglycan-associated protein
MERIIKGKLFLLLVGLIILGLTGCASDKEARKKSEIEALQKKFEWWPTDAKPAPVKDQRGGYWWWPEQPGQVKLWGNRGFVYVYKIIYDYKADELPAAKESELRPSLLIRKIIKNVKIYFDYDKAALRQDAMPILAEAVKALNKNPQADILITGNCDTRGTEAYNEKLGKKRADAVKTYMLDNGVPEARVRIISRGKLDAVAHVKDLVGMQKERNAQFMVAEVEEIMIPAPPAGSTGTEIQKVIPPDAQKIEEGKFVEETKEEVESEVKVSTREYVVQKGDSLSKIAQKEMGGAHRWKYLYELNKDKIKNPNKLKTGIKIVIPVE